MKFLLTFSCLTLAFAALAYPKSYSADVSTQEKRDALIKELWAHDESRDVKLWPSERQSPGAEKTPFKLLENELFQRNLIIGEVVSPQFTFYPAPGEGKKPMVVVFPGGGYHVLGWNKEGTEIASWLNSLGISAAVLLYRTDDRDAALCDAERTISLLRRDAAKYSIEANAIGVIGFSAGANLAVRLSTNYRTRHYERVDDAEDHSCRPDFMMPIYPWDLRPRRVAGNPWLGWQKTHALDAAYPVDKDTPPAFIVQSLDDFCEIETAVALDYAMTKAGAKSVLKIYQNGGHGYGRRVLGHATDTWSYEAAHWLAELFPRNITLE